MYVDLVRQLSVFAPELVDVVHTLLLENSSLTPRPELLCMIVLYSPSSSSLRS